jgi:hypothetical protein
MVSRLPIALMPFALAALMAGCANPGMGGAGYAGGSQAGTDSSVDSSAYTPLQSGASPSDCDTQPVQNMLGQAYSDSVGDTLRQRANARAIRVLKPGQVMTMEYNPTRINIILDAKGAIEALRCG